MLKGVKIYTKFFSKKNIKTFVQLGSALEYGSMSSPQTEDKEGKPRTLMVNASSMPLNFLKI